MQDPNFGKTDQNKVVSHDTTWYFNEAETINPFKDVRFKPQLHVQHLQKMTKLDFWLALFPSEQIYFIQSTQT